MADAFRFEHKTRPEITEPEFQGGLELEDWKSSPDFPSHGDVSLLRTTPKDQPRTTAPRVTAEEYDDREIIASAENKESPQKTGFIKPKQDENLSNFLGEIEHEAGLELIIVPPVCATPIPGSSSLRGARGTEIASSTSKEFHDSDESPESISRLSRIESAKQDMKNLKSATLGRMGKMFKIRPPTPAERETTDSNRIEQGVEPGAIAERQYGQDPTRKEKTHSLGRMLRLVDKDGAPRKLFSHTRTGSLTRLRKLHSTVGNVAGSSDESRNIFSRMLSQFRDELSGRNSGATNAEPNLQSTNGPENSPKPSLGTRLMMSLSARGTPAGGTTAGTTGDETSLERVSVEYAA